MFCGAKNCARVARKKGAETAGGQSRHVTCSLVRPHGVVYNRVRTRGRLTSRIQRVSTLVHPARRGRTGVDPHIHKSLKRSTHTPGVPSDVQVHERPRSERGSEDSESEDEFNEVSGLAGAGFGRRHGRRARSPSVPWSRPPSQTFRPAAALPPHRRTCDYTRAAENSW